MTTEEIKQVIKNIHVAIETSKHSIGIYEDCTQQEIERIEQNEQKLILLQNEQLKAEQEVYYPNYTPARGENYYRINECGEIENKTFYTISSHCEWDLTTSNAYKTEAQAEKGKQAVELMAEIRETYKKYHQNYIALIILAIALDNEHILHVFRPTDIIEEFGDRIQQLKEYL